MKNSTKEKKLSQWTSWEGYNYILKGLVDELISLGACPQLKPIALQLWANYLCKLQVAFTSTEEELLPKLGFNQNFKDYTIMLNLARKRRQELRRLCEDKLPTSENHMDEGVVNLEQFMDNDTFEAELETSRDIVREIKCAIKFIKAYKQHLRAAKINSFSSNRKIGSIPETMTNYAKLVSEVYSKKRRKSALQIIYTSHLSMHSPLYLSRRTVLAILILALIFSRSPIQISDVIRWIHERHISYQNVIRHFPKHIKMNAADRLFIITTHDFSYSSVQLCLLKLTRFLDIIEFPVPNLKALTHRFLLELQLPSEIGDYVERLMVSYKIDKLVWMMSYEKIVMSMIIIVLKSLFGLDGYTEHKISKFATQINCMMGNESNDECIPKLFVWDDWVRYTECRKAVVSDNHFPSQMQFDKNVSATVDSYVHLTTTEQKNIHHLKNHHMNTFTTIGSRLRHEISDKAVEELPKWKRSRTKHDFLPSLTPQVSYLDVILSNWHSHGCYRSDTVPPVEILTYDHASSSVEFLVQPDKIIQFADSQGVDVVIMESPVHLDYIPVAVNVFAQRGNATTECILTDEVDDNSSNSHELQQLPGVVSSLKPSRQENPKSGSKEKSNSSIDVDVMLLEPKKKKQKIKRDMENRSLSSDGDISQENTHNWKHSSKHLQEEPSPIRNVNDTTSSECNTLTLYLPLSAYWVYDIQSTKCEQDFKHLSKADFSQSFHWLLNECSTVLQTTTLDLYAAVWRNERLFAGIVDLREWKGIERI